jgi:hypothetical protein
MRGSSRIESTTNRERWGNKGDAIFVRGVQAHESTKVFATDNLGSRQVSVGSVTSYVTSGSIFPLMQASDFKSNSVWPLHRGCWCEIATTSGGFRRQSVCCRATGTRLAWKAPSGESQAVEQFLPRWISSVS